MTIHGDRQESAIWNVTVSKHEGKTDKSFEVLTAVELTWSAGSSGHGYVAGSMLA